MNEQMNLVRVVAGAICPDPTDCEPAAFGVDISRAKRALDALRSAIRDDPSLLTELGLERAREEESRASLREVVSAAREAEAVLEVARAGFEHVNDLKKAMLCHSAERRIGDALALYNTRQVRLDFLRVWAVRKER